MSSPLRTAQAVGKRIARLKQAIAAFDYVCSGTLLRRSPLCGKKNCRCKGEPPAPHGPYYYWSRRHEGRLVQKVLSTAQAKIVAQAIRNYRRIQEYLRRWEQQTVKIIEARRHTNH